MSNPDSGSNVMDYFTLDDDGHLIYDGKIYGTLSGGKVVWDNSLGIPIQCDFNKITLKPFGNNGEFEVNYVGQEEPGLIRSESRPTPPKPDKPGKVEALEYIFNTEIRNYPECAWFDPLENKYRMDLSSIGEHSIILVSEATNPLKRFVERKSRLVFPEKGPITPTIEDVTGQIEWDVRKAQNIRHPFLERVRNFQLDHSYSYRPSIFSAVGMNTQGILEDDEEIFYREKLERIFTKTVLDRSLSIEKFWISRFKTGESHVEDLARIDSTLCLMGPQGHGKSTLLEQFGLGMWHRPFKLGEKINSTQLYEAFNGGIIGEAREGMQETDVDDLKACIDQTYIQYRKPYDREESVYPISYVMSMTTNRNQPLKDYTGNRRFLPAYVDCMIQGCDDPRSIPVKEYLTSYRISYEEMERGMLWRDDLKEIESMAKKMQEVTRIDPPYLEETLDAIDYLKDQIPDRVNGLLIKEKVILDSDLKEALYGKIGPNGRNEVWGVIKINPGLYNLETKPSGVMWVPHLGRSSRAHKVIPQKQD